MKLEELVQELEESIEELIRKGNAKAGSVLVIGCSTSEILGNRIGTGGSLKAAKAFFAAVHKVTKKHKIMLAAQCCEHLNRALVVEEKTMEKLGLQEVTVRPVEHAGGAASRLRECRRPKPPCAIWVQRHAGFCIFLSRKKRMVSDGAAEPPPNNAIGLPRHWAKGDMIRYGTHYKSTQGDGGHRPGEIGKMASDGGRVPQ